MGRAQAVIVVNTLFFNVVRAIFNLKLTPGLTTDA